MPRLPARCCQRGDMARRTPLASAGQESSTENGALPMKPTAMKRSCLAALVCLVGSLFAPAHARAQCTTHWLPGDGVPGTDGGVYATTRWDPDGAGPLQPVLVVGGTFSVAGTIQAANIATYDPASGAWSALGSGLSWGVFALTTMPNGDLVAGGEYTTAGGVGVPNLARWDGTSWSTLGSGVVGRVCALTTMPNGDVVAGGHFSTAGGVSAYGLARWDGIGWSAFPSALAYAGYAGRVYALTTLPNGDLVAGGTFTAAGG